MIAMGWMFVAGGVCYAIGFIAGWYARNAGPRRERA